MIHASYSRYAIPNECPLNHTRLMTGYSSILQAPNMHIRGTGKQGISSPASNMIMATVLHS